MDYKKSEDKNHVSRESKDLIADMGNNEIFELSGTSSKRQCVKGMYPALHVHEHLRYTNGYGKLRTSSRTT